MAMKKCQGKEPDSNELPTIDQSESLLSGGCFSAWCSCARADTIVLFPLTLILIFSNFAYHIIRQVLSMSIKGNPVQIGEQIGDGPAAVIPLFSMWKINPFSLVCHCSRREWEGR
jgi:hypothetical protein